MNYVEFNQIADQLKSDPDKWKGVFRDQINRLSAKDLSQIINTHPYSLAGYDLEVVSEFFTTVKKRIENESPTNTAFQNLAQTDMTKLNYLISSFKTKVLSEVNENTDMSVLGGGALNTVYEIHYKDPETGMPMVGVFKPDPAELPFTKLKQEQFFGTSVASGIPPGPDALLTKRAKASSQVDSLLYGDDPISVSTEFVVVNGKRGILMSKAVGKSPKVLGVVEDEIDPNQLAPYFKALKINPNSFSENEKQMLATSFNYRKFEIIDGKIIGTRATLRNLDPGDPAKLALTAEGLVKLQVKDIITGECDRHPDNYIIDKNGKVIGIDEDCCFGVNAIPEKKDVRDQDKLMGVVPNKGSLMLRMPPVITKTIKNDIEKFYFNRHLLIAELGPLISKEEIEATFVRLEKLHDHINSKNCLIVPSKEALIEAEAQSRQDSNNSYFKREMLVLLKDEEKWNHLRKHREKGGAYESWI
jgi:hypothetical protein